MFALKYNLLCVMPDWKNLTQLGIKKRERKKEVIYLDWYGDDGAEQDENGPAFFFSHWLRSAKNSSITLALLDSSHFRKNHNTSMPFRSGRTGEGPHLRGYKG